MGFPSFSMAVFRPKTKDTFFMMHSSIGFFNFCFIFLWQFFFVQNENKQRLRKYSRQLAAGASPALSRASAGGDNGATPPHYFSIHFSVRFFAHARLKKMATVVFLPSPQKMLQPV